MHRDNSHSFIQSDCGLKGVNAVLLCSMGGNPPSLIFGLLERAAQGGIYITDDCALPVSSSTLGSLQMTCLRTEMSALGSDGSSVVHVSSGSSSRALAVAAMQAGHIQNVSSEDDAVGGVAPAHASAGASTTPCTSCSIL